jgi:hypothetical protein
MAEARGGRAGDNSFGRDRVEDMTEGCKKERGKEAKLKEEISRVSGSRETKRKKRLGKKKHHKVRKAQHPVGKEQQRASSSTREVQRRGKISGSIRITQLR